MLKRTASEKFIDSLIEKLITIYKKNRLAECKYKLGKLLLNKKRRWKGNVTKLQEFEYGLEKQNTLEVYWHIKMPQQDEILIAYAER
jgi:hypothetical protein